LGIRATPGRDERSWDSEILQISGYLTPDLKSREKMARTAKTLSPLLRVTGCESQQSSRKGNTFPKKARRPETPTDVVEKRHNINQFSIQTATPRFLSQIIEEMTSVTFSSCTDSDRGDLVHRHVSSAELLSHMERFSTKQSYNQSRVLTNFNYFRDLYQCRSSVRADNAWGLVPHSVVTIIAS
jgi:hypothetical protein